MPAPGPPHDHDIGTPRARARWTDLRAMVAATLGRCPNCRRGAPSHDPASRSKRTPHTLQRSASA